VLTLDAAESTLWAGEQTPAKLTRSAIHRAQELSAIALHETQDVAYRLRPDRFVENGLVAASNRLATSAGVPVSVVADPYLAVPGLLDPEDEMNVYRVIQEAVNNAVRHAQAGHIRIEFRSDGTILSVLVVDDGIGLDANEAEHRGLGFAGMRERALILRARLEIASGRDGTTITLSVPLPRRQAPPSSASAQPAIQGGVSS
jgi:signal transduction histidine kinase